MFITYKIISHMNLQTLIGYFKKIHETEHKIWFTMEEIEKIIKEYESTFP